MTDGGVRDALITAKQRGVKVKLIVDGDAVPDGDPDNGKATGSEYSALTAASGLGTLYAAYRSYWQALRTHGSSGASLADYDRTRNTGPYHISQEQAREVINAFVAERLIKLESPSTATGRISLDGWNPVELMDEPGNVAGVIVRYWPTGRKGTEGQISSGSAPDRLDPRNAMAFVLMCQMLNTAWGITELYHAGISGDRPGGRNDCHGQGRAVDFVRAGESCWGKRSTSPFSMTGAGSTCQ
ncbi:hypothetical protein ACQI4E_32520 [Streptomyces sp. CA-252508]|uniref:hypothetical protein n=1 Tax=Streptomyces sp. CA-252508 TaxID=3418946 RepID=UPI003D8D8988